jgi:hypothetical protein
MKSSAWFSINKMLLLQSGDDTSHSSGAARAGKGSQSSATGRDFVSPINWRNVIMTPSRNSCFFNLAPMKAAIAAFLQG